MSETNFVGSVTMEERNELLLLHERILGIQELEYTFNSELLSENDKIQLREKMKREIEAAVKGKEQWWKNTSQKYHWKSEEGKDWIIDFKTFDIYLI